MIFRTLVILVFAISFNIFSAGTIGSCIQDPNALALQNRWKHFHDLKKKKAHVNISVLVDQIRMDKETMRFIQAVSESEQLIKILDELEMHYMRKAFIDTRFNDLVASDTFLSKLESGAVDAEIKASSLKFKNDPKFYALLEQARNEIKKPEIKDALDLFRTYDLGILEVSYRKSAKYALQLIRGRGATIEVVRSWIADPPYLRNIPYPGVKLGPFAIKYRAMIERSISNFVSDRKISLIEAQKSFPNIKQAEVDEMNTIQPPNENNSFDDYIASINTPEEAAVDGVARTLWGEATSCQVQGLSQFEAIGRIIADRSLAVCKSIDELSQLKVKSVEVREKNWGTFLSNWAGINRPAPGMQNRPTVKFHGLSDFGRREKTDLPCAAQVISKKNQFSVWNSYNINRYHVGQFNPNIPDSVYEIQGPQATNDDKALIRILCPEFKTDEQKQLWVQAESIAREIVTNPKGLAKRITWPVKGEILFYTHDASLPFAKEIKVPFIKVNNKKKILRKKGRDACNKFRLFVPKQSNQY